MLHRLNLCMCLFSFVFICISVTIYYYIKHPMSHISTSTHTYSHTYLPFSVKLYCEYYRRICVLCSVLCVLLLWCCNVWNCNVGNYVNWKSLFDFIKSLNVQMSSLSHRMFVFRHNPFSANRHSLWARQNYLHHLNGFAFIHSMEFDDERIWFWYDKAQSHRTHITQTHQTWIAFLQNRQTQTATHKHEIYWVMAFEWSPK